MIDKAETELQNMKSSNLYLEQQLQTKKEIQKDQYNGLTDKEREELILMDGQINSKRQQWEQEKASTVELEKKALDLKQNELLQEMIKFKIQCDQAQKEYNELQSEIDNYYSFDRASY